MNIEELKKILIDKVEDFEQFLMDDCTSYDGKTLVSRKDLDLFKSEAPDSYLILEDHLGFEIKVVESERDYSEYYVIFEVEGKYYKVDGRYDSWNGIDFYDPYDFYEVEKTTRTVTLTEWKKK